MSTVELHKPEYLLPMLFVAAAGLLCLIVVLAIGIVFIRDFNRRIATLGKKVDALCCAVENFCPDRTAESFYRRLEPHFTANSNIARDLLTILQFIDGLRRASGPQGDGDASVALCGVEGVAEDTVHHNVRVLTKQSELRISISPKNVGLKWSDCTLGISGHPEVESCNIKQIPMNGAIDTVYGVRGHPLDGSQGIAADVSRMAFYGGSIKGSVCSACDNASYVGQYRFGGQGVKTPDTMGLGDYSMSISRSLRALGKDFFVKPDCESSRNMSINRSLHTPGKDCSVELDYESSDKLTNAYACLDELERSFNSLGASFNDTSAILDGLHEPDSVIGSSEGNVSLQSILEETPKALGASLDDSSAHVPGGVPFLQHFTSPLSGTSESKKSKISCGP